MPVKAKNWFFWQNSKKYDEEFFTYLRQMDKWYALRGIKIDRCRIFNEIIQENKMKVKK